MTREDHLYVLHARSLVHTGEDIVVVEGIGEEAFTLLKCAAPPDAEFEVGERISIGNEDTSTIDHVQARMGVDDLSGVARDALEDVLEELVETNDDRFVEVLNTAGPLSLRRHQLDLLPTVGEARRNRILDERDRRPFDDLDDVVQRVDGVSSLAAAIAERIATELADEEVQYRLFVE